MIKFIILLYFPDRVMRREVMAENYADALTQVYPSNDIVKVEIIGV